MFDKWALLKLRFNHFIKLVFVVWIWRFFTLEKDRFQVFEMQQLLKAPKIKFQRL